MTTPDIDQTVVLPFADGDAVCPRWWGSLPPFRLGPEHGAYAPRLPFTRAEAQAIVNKTLDAEVLARAMSQIIGMHPVRLRR